MHANVDACKVFTSATEDRLESMNQALRLVFLFEFDLLQKPDFASGPVSIQHVFDQYDVSRSVGYEAIRILQHRDVVRVKRGPNGGLQPSPQNNENLKSAIALFLLQKKPCFGRCKQATESLAFVMSHLSPGNPAKDLVALVLDVLRDMENEHPGSPPAAGATQSNLRANQIARLIVLNTIVKSQQNHSRIGHEDELCEQFQVSKPVIRQAIRILESQTVVEARRGRGCGLYLVEPKPGPVSRLIALWMLAQKMTLSQVFELEHPLRVAVAMRAAQNNLSGQDYRYLMGLQGNMESGGQLRLVDVIEMEKHISWLADNDVLDLLLMTMTVYKLCRAHYREIVPDRGKSFASMNRQFLGYLVGRKETKIERFSQEKNAFLKTLDIGSMRA